MTHESFMLLLSYSCCTCIKMLYFHVHGKWAGCEDIHNYCIIQYGIFMCSGVNVSSRLRGMNHRMGWGVGGEVASYSRVKTA